MGAGGKGEHAGRRHRAPQTPRSTARSRSLGQVGQPATSGPAGAAGAARAARAARAAPDGRFMGAAGWGLRPRCHHPMLLTSQIGRILGFWAFLSGAPISRRKKGSAPRRKSQAINYSLHVSPGRSGGSDPAVWSTWPQSAGYKMKSVLVVHVDPAGAGRLPALPRPRRLCLVALGRSAACRPGRPDRGRGMPPWPA
jgi:hypothetical protein